MAAAPAIPPTVAYFDCFSGIAGDMALGALVDAGVAVEDLESALETIEPLRGEWKLEVKRVHKGSGMIAGTKVDVWSIYDHPGKFGTASVAPLHAALSVEQDSAGEEVAHANPASTEHLTGRHVHGHGHGHGHGHTHGHTHGGDGVCSHNGNGHAHSHAHGHAHDGDRASSHDDHGHAHGHAHDSATGPMRGYREIEALLKASSLSQQVVDFSLAAFHVLAKAEARVHGMSVDDVHFHEVGAVDSIIDTVGVVIGLELLGVSFSHIYCSALPFTSGFVRCQHGLMPVPAPATLEMLCGVPTYPCTAVRGELITPTGACLLRALVTDGHWGLTPRFVPLKTGFGAGTKEFADRPNLLRLVIGKAAPGLVSPRRVGVSAPQTDAPRAADHVPTLVQTSEATQPDGAREAGLPMRSRTVAGPTQDVAGTANTADTVPAASCPLQRHSLLCIETNIDDMNPQLFEMVLSSLFAVGARDAWVSNVLMKKGRPAYTLSALCDSEKQLPVMTVILEQTTTLGVRVSRVDRLSLERRFESVETQYGQVSIKLGLWGERILNAHPEYEDCKRLAAAAAVPVALVFDAAKAAYHNGRQV
jgi:uncharacterized protein (TIGR00299 family) protein